MGSGKSTVGKIIANELFLSFLDTDDEIEKGTGVTICLLYTSDAADE